jgi:uncharacterized protein (TIGR02145 family)
MKSAVTFFRPFLFSLSVLVLFAQCKKDPSTNKEEDPIISEVVNIQNKRLEKVVPTATTTSFLQGVVLDESGTPLSGVEVKAGDKTQTTDSEGKFVFGEITINKDYAVVSAQKTGFMKGFRTFSPTSGAINKVEIRLQSRGVAQNIEAASGGEVIFESGKVKLDFPAGSIADAEGKPYSGAVKVYAKYINPDSEGFSSTMPGNLVGLADNNELSGMISYGMANVELTDNSGNALQIAGGKKVKVTMPAIKDAPSEMPVWHFNEQYGLWVEAGRATKTGSTYSFEANHFSSWNLDIFVENGIPKVTITVKTAKGKPLANQEIQIYTADFSNSLTLVTTDEKGQFILLHTPRNLGLRIIQECRNIDRTLSISSENETVTLSNLTGNGQVYDLSGLVKDCDSIYANAYFTLTGLTQSNISFTGKTDANGAFETSVIVCDVNSDTKYQVRATVYTANNTVKIDTIELTFSSTTLQKDINFCESEEEVFSPHLNPALTYGSVTDIDGNKYATIQIGTQTWMAENLRTTSYANGDPIPNVTDRNQWQNLTTGAWAHNNNDSQYENPYGKLYNWYTVADPRNVCPTGWHVPSDTEWSKVINYLDPNANGGDNRPNTAGGKMKSMGTDYWRSPNTDATNESGFSGLPGERNDFGAFIIGGYGRWWSSTEVNTSTVWIRTLSYLNGSVSRGGLSRGNGFYVRCLRD